jgi:hypothetical protein
MNQPLSQTFIGSPKCEWQVPLKLVCVFPVALFCSYSYGDDRIAMLDRQFSYVAVLLSIIREKSWPGFEAAFSLCKILCAGQVSCIPFLKIDRLWFCKRHEFVFAKTTSSSKKKHI